MGWYPNGQSASGIYIFDQMSTAGALASAPGASPINLLGFSGLSYSPAAGTKYALPDPLGPTFTGEGTVSLWVRRNNVAGNSGSPIAYSNSTLNSHYPYAPNGLIYLAIFYGGGSRKDDVTSLVDFTQPHLLTITASGSAGQWRAYQNGMLLTYDNTYSAPAALAYRGLGGNETAVNYWDGDIADFRVYNRALTESEVWALYDPATRYELYEPVHSRNYLKAAAANVTRTSDFNITIGAV